MISRRGKTQIYLYLEPALYCTVFVRFDVREWVSEEKKVRSLWYCLIIMITWYQRCELASPHRDRQRCSLQSWNKEVRRVYNTFVLTLCARALSILKCSVLEGERELLGLCVREAAHDHHGVGEEDAVHGETSLLDWVLVHIFLSFILN